MKPYKFKMSSPAYVVEREVDRIYAALCALLCVLMVTGNLIFRKFITLNFLNLINFDISVGLLVFPLTFIITDIMAECYGKKNAISAVIIGFFIDLLVIAVVGIADHTKALPWSPISGETFHHVFGFYHISFAASLTAFMIAQIVDINFFVHIRKLTHGKHLWLRGNVSTMCAQLVDTFCVLGILFLAGVLPGNQYFSTFISSLTYKACFCFLGTPLLYLAIFYIKKSLKNQL